MMMMMMMDVERRAEQRKRVGCRVEQREGVDKKQ